MPKPERTFVEKITTIAGAIAALGGVLAAATQFSDQVKGLLGKLAELPPAAWWVIAGLLLSVGIFGLMHGLARRSRLLRPEALLLKSHKAEHLKGREEDIDRLLTLCRDYPLVHLVGESGAGKSALLQAGICPKLRQDSAGLLPIYLEVWGQDWEAGPRSALTEAFWQALSEPDRQVLNLNALEQPDNLFAALKRCQPLLRRTLLLIFDQFDDYQTRHRPRFLPSRQRTWLGAEKLVAANAFWREIKTLLDDDAIHCLFVTRSDTAAGLESVRFVAPQVYALERLQEAVVQPLLTELTSSADENAPIIYALERGWDKLKQRLAGDLSQQGAVLPAQMKIAFQGLARLKTLTIGEYQRLGGLPGLEARHIEYHVAEAERHFSHTRQGVQLTQKQIRGLLLALVNRETLKTVPRSNDELEQVILDDYVSETKPMQQAVQAGLDYLEKREIIRKRIDPDTRRQLWLLDHDYLCAGVLEAERRANRWLALAEAGSRAFQEAGSHILKRWRALLSPWQQLVLVMQRLLGRFRYGTLRAYALWSLLRFTPYVLVPALASYGWYLFSAKEQASEILSKIGVSTGEPTPSEINALWILAISNEAVRFSFLEQALAIPENAERFSRRLDVAVQALVGLDSALREKILKEVLLPHLQSPRADARTKMACVKIGIALVMQDSTFTSLAGQFLAEVMDPNMSFESFQILARILAALPGKPAPEDADRAFAQILAYPMEGTIYYFSELQPLDEALAAVAGKLAPEHADSAFVHILARIERTTNSYKLLSLTHALAAVPGKPAPEEADRAFAYLLAQMEKTTGSSVFSELQSLAQALAAMSGKLASEYADRAFAQILAQMEKTTDPFALRYLVVALAAVPGKLASEDADRAFAQILAQMEKTTDPFALRYLVVALAAVPGKLAPEDADRTFAQILARIEKRTNPIVLLFLAEALVAVPGRLTPEDADRVFAQILARMEKTTDSSELRDLAQALTAVARKLAPEHADSAFAQILMWMEKPIDPDVLKSLAEILAVVPGKLAPEDADTAFVRILARIEKTTYPWELRSLFKALAAVPGDRNPQQLINLIKWPTCVGEERAPLLTKLEQQTGQKFEGNVWNMVKWAQAYGYNVKSPPQRPGR